jgi:indolepyruvate ferredoxin oxidoreductase beta subunit
MREERSRRPLRILLAGTGGQGVVTAAEWLTSFFAERGREVTSGQLHGMAQRGGAVSASLMVDSGPSPRIAEGRADVVLGLEPVETARALPFISSSTTVLMNTRPVVPFVVAQSFVRKRNGGSYPEVSELEAALRAVTPHLVALDFTRLAEESGSPRALNMVMLGALFGIGLLPDSPGEFLEAVRSRIPPRLSSSNEIAFLSGVRAAESFQTVGEKP